MLLEDISNGNQIESGIVLSKNPLMSPLWVDGRNVYFSEGSVWKARGFQKLGQLPSQATIRGGSTLRSGGNNVLYFGDIGNLHKFVNGTLSVVGTGYQGIQNEAGNVPASNWVMEAWGQWMAATNGVDNIQLDKGSGFGNLSGTPPTYAKVILKFNNFLLAFNTDQGDTAIEWCNLDNIEDWVGGAGKEASVSPLIARELDGAIIAASKIGQRIAIYSETNAVILEYRGNPFWFGLRPGSIDGIGACSPKAVVQRDNLNYGFSEQGIWRTDSISFDRLDTPDIRRWLEANVNWTQKSKINGFLNEARGMIEWNVPTGSSLEPTVTIAYNFNNPAKGFTFRDYAWSTSITKKHLDFPIGADSLGNFYNLESGLNKDTQPLVAYVQSKPLYAESPEYDKLVNEVRLLLRDLAGTGVRVQIGIQDNIDDDIVWSQLMSVDDGREAIFPKALGTNRPLREGKYITFKILSTALGDDFTLSGFSLHGEYVGERKK